jgi:DNA-binding response OmpR family regulator
MNNTLIRNSLVTDYQQQEKPFNIMLIEDKPDTLLTYKAFLLSEGYNVDAFLDANEAFKAVCQIKPSLL